MPLDHQSKSAQKALKSSVWNINYKNYIKLLFRLIKGSEKKSLNKLGFKEIKLKLMPPRNGTLSV